MSLIRNENGSWSVVQKESSIAERLFNSMYPKPDFEIMFNRYMKELTNMSVMNRDFEKKIAFFRYVDGSTVHLEGLTSRFTPPCTTCPDVRKCTCSIHEELSL